MAMNGMSMMMKSLGINPEELTQGVEEFKVVIINALNNTTKNQQEIITKLDVIVAKCEETLRILESSRDCNGVIMVGDAPENGEISTKLYANLYDAINGETYNA